MKKTYQVSLTYLLTVEADSEMEALELAEREVQEYPELWNDKYIESKEE